MIFRQHTLFQTLLTCRETIAEKIKLDPLHLELSMGMSNDFEHAVSVM